MPLDSEKKRLEARLLQLLGRALEERNRDDIAERALELGALYLSGDLYDKAEEYFRKVMDAGGAEHDAREHLARAELGLARVALRRGHLTLARESLEHAAKRAERNEPLDLEVRLLHAERDLHTGIYQDVVDNIEATLSRSRSEDMGDIRVEFMVLEGRARHLLGRHRQAGRLLHKALELAGETGYEAGASGAHSELGVLRATIGEFKRANEHFEEAIRSDEGMGSQYRLDRDRARRGHLLILMGRWDEASELLEQAYTSSRDLRTLDNRLESQLGRAALLCLRGRLDEGHDLALDAMEVARAAGFVRHHVQGLRQLACIELAQQRERDALERLHEAEALYTRLAPESDLLQEIHGMLGEAHDRLGEFEAGFERLMRAHNLARETGNDLFLRRVDRRLGEHFHRTGELRKALDMLSRAASGLGEMGAKYDVAVARLRYAAALAESRHTRPAAQQAEETKRATSNVFEARRLLEPMGAQPLLSECDALERQLQPRPRARSSE